MAEVHDPDVSDEDVRKEIVGGKTVAEWDKEWSRVPQGFEELQSDLRDKVGLYRAVKDGNVVALGKACEYKNGGLRKRLADFRRNSPSGRNHWMGIYIHRHKGELECEVLVTGSDADAAMVAKHLKPLMIMLHKPDQNVPDDIIAAKIEANSRDR